MKSWFSRTRTMITRDSLEDASARGQVIIMFALFLTVMVGVLGLAVDVGFAVSQRRSMQNAADAGALAGTHMVAKSNPLAPISVKSQVDAIVTKNAMSGGTIGSIDCEYVNDSGSWVAPCTAAVPPDATGVRVTVVETHPTFFIKVVPGVSDTVDTSARAMANVKTLSTPRDGPFMPCGLDSERPSGPDLDILVQVGGVWKINPAAVGETFEIHGPQISDCEAKSSRFKGLADVDANKNRTAPGWFMYKEGDTAGFISEDVEGPDGCKAGQEAVNCVAFLPIAIPGELDNTRQMWVVAFAPFYITAPKSNEHYGKLVADYMVAGKGENGDWGWNPDHTGPITIRLTE